MRPNMVQAVAAGTATRVRAECQADRMAFSYGRRGGARNRRVSTVPASEGGDGQGICPRRVMQAGPGLPHEPKG